MNGWLNLSTVLFAAVCAVTVGLRLNRRLCVVRVRARLAATVTVWSPVVQQENSLLMHRWSRLMSHRRHRQISAALPAGLEAISRSLRSGASLPNALTEAAMAAPPALGQELGHIARELKLGRSPVESFAAFERRLPLSDVRLATAALGLAMETGGARSRALDGLAQSIRDRQALRVEVRALASQARMSALVMAVLPLGFLGVTAATDEAVAQLLLTTPLGALCLVGGIGLDAVGLLWMQTMVRRA